VPSKLRLLIIYLFGVYLPLVVVVIL